MRFIVRHLSLESLRECAEHLEFSDEHDAFAALPALVGCLCESGVPAEAFELLKTLERDIPACTSALAAMAPSMRVSDLLDAPAWLDSLDNVHAAEPALVEVVEVLASADHSSIALQRARAMIDPVWRAAALAAMAQHMADSKSLVEHAIATMEPLPCVDHRQTAVRKITIALAGVDAADAARLLVRLIATLCQTLRLNFVAELNTLAPAFAKAGGPEAVRGLVRAVRQSVRWWP